MGCCWFAAICLSCSAWDTSGQQGMGLGGGPPGGFWPRAEGDAEPRGPPVMVKEGPADAGRSWGELACAWQ